MCSFAVIYLLRTLFVTLYKKLCSPRSYTIAFLNFINRAKAPLYHIPFVHATLFLPLLNVAILRVIMVTHIFVGDKAFSATKQLSIRTIKYCPFLRTPVVHII